MSLVKVTIDDKELSVPEEYTVLQAAREAKINIPTLCFLKSVNEIGACRICLVEVQGARSLQAACVLPVSEGMVVYTHTPEVREARKVTLELILSDHDRSCLTCNRHGNCELQKLAEEFNIQELRFERATQKYRLDDFSPSVVRDSNKCILCRRCVSMCGQKQKISAIAVNARGFHSIIGPAFDRSLAEAPCVLCGQCINVCPVGALREKDDTDLVWQAIEDPTKHVIVQTAPAVRAALGEEFGMPIGTPVTGKMVTALRRLGFAKVFDTDTAADLTIMEEGTELLHRLQPGGVLPLITSCSPGWIKYMEHNYADLIPNVSSCKSPHTMFGALLKNYYAEQNQLDPKDIVVVSVMPCTAKKFEAKRPELSTNGNPDVDIVITTRELGKMLREAHINFVDLGEGNFDHPFPTASGAAHIFGASGGVMEAALRTVAEIVNGEELQDIEFHEVRGLAGIKEATIKLKGIDLKVAVTSGLGNAQVLLEKIRAGEADYHFVEIMACHGGCINGGGQPIQPSSVRSWTNLKELRMAALYQEDSKATIRQSHKNPLIQALYQDYLEEPGSKKAHQLLHTHYQARENYPE